MRRRAQKDRTPGTVSEVLRRKMPDHLADLLDDYGQSIYAESVLAIKEDLSQIFESKMADLTSDIKAELGRRGVDEAGPHFKPWMNEVVEALNEFGMQEVSGTLEDLAGSYSAEYITEEEEEDSGDDLFSVDDGDVEEVEEVKEEAPKETEEAAPEEGENLEDLFGEGDKETTEEEAAANIRPRRKRRRPLRRRREAMFHISNLGKYGDLVRRYADIDGYVPQRGDLYEDFNYPVPNDFDNEDYWEEWVEEAERATEKAERGVSRWQRGASLRKRANSLLDRLHRG